MVFGIFKEEERVNVQTVFVFKKTRRCFDVFQFRACRQALSQLRLYAKAFIVVRLDQIHPYGINEGL